MAAATNRADLIATTEKEFAKLEALLGGWLMIWRNARLRAGSASRM